MVWSDAGRLLVFWRLFVMSRILLLCLLLVVGVEKGGAQELNFLTNKKQITFTGPRSGEGYFSPDGKEMILQSEREPGNPFYQIYRMNLQTGKTERLSPGQGKTTCAWFHPSMKKALFSSTHLDKDIKSKVEKEYENRKSSIKQKYSWSYDDQFEIFEVDLKTKKLKALTKSLGYDAEASYSPDGKLIAFASNRPGYLEKLEPDDQKLFSQDASYMMEIYIMNSDGSNVRRLTNHKGYDGGPFFSADGSKITWRRFAPNGQSAEIMTMNLDGSDQKQLTKMGAMSWAPYYHPSGDYLIYTTNVLGYSNFELYIVDAAGTKAPVRVTDLAGFDGLPVFHPDGNRIAWTHHNEKGESHIYMADWDDAKARAVLGLPAQPKISQVPTKGTEQEFLKGIVEYLASETFAGRSPGSPQEKVYSQGLADMMKQLGLTTLPKKSFLQTFEFSSGVNLGPKEKMLLKIGEKTKELKVGQDYNPLSFSASGEFKEAPIVFAGYGIKAPANEKQPKYDSYATLNVKGKWVLAFRDIPESIPTDRRVFLNTYSRLHHKALVAREQGALGLILVNGPNSASKEKITKLRFDGAKFAGTGLPVLSISNDVAEELMKVSGLNLKQVQDALDKGDLKDFELKGSAAQAFIDLQELKSTGINVIGQILVPGAKETVVLGAHGDHLGIGITGSSLAKDNEKDKAHLGADDNASGVAGMLMVAKALQAEKKNLKRNVVFAVWSAEEIGLIGSSLFAKDLKRSLPGQKVVAYLNLDMVGRLKDQLIVQGVASAKEWPGLFEEVAISSEVPLSLVDDPYVPSDAMAFYLQGVPSVHFFTGAHTEYHTPRDTPDLINYPGLEKVAKTVKVVTLKLATKETSAAKLRGLTYQKVESSKKQMEGRSFRVFVGTIPDYAQEGVKGVRISGTSKNSPAEKSGLKSGDVIVEVGGTKIENLYDYVYVLQALKPNETVSLKIKRGEKVENLSVTPTLKE